MTFLMQLLKQAWQQTVKEQSGLARSFWPMRSVSFSMPQRTERVHDVTPTKQTREESQTKRVRDVKQAEKRTKKNPRLFRIRRKPMTPQQQRQFAKMLNSYQCLFTAATKFHAINNCLCALKQ